MSFVRDDNGTNQDPIMGDPNPPQPINMWPDPAPLRWSGQPTSPRPRTVPPQIFKKKTYTHQLKWNPNLKNLTNMGSL